jgi:hypothetical protein
MCSDLRSIAGCSPSNPHRCPYANSPKAPAKEEDVADKPKRGRPKKDAAAAAATEEAPAKKAKAAPKAAAAAAAAPMAAAAAAAPAAKKSGGKLSAGDQLPAFELETDGGCARRMSTHMGGVLLTGCGYAAEQLGV